MNKVIEQDLKELIQSDLPIEQLDGCTVLVTGATGLIAKYFCWYLLEEARNGHDIKVIGLVRNIEKAKKAYADYLNEGNIEFIVQDVCSKLTYPGKIDYIFHAAGSASPYHIRNNPTGIIEANTLGAINVLNLAKEKKVKKVIFPSTREIYGKVEGTDLMDEETMGVLDPLDPRSCYPESKRLTETIFEAYYQQYQIPFNVLRIAHTYGPAMEINNDGRVMSDFIHFVVNNEDIVLNSDGTARRSFCYITDLIRGIVLVMAKGSDNGAYNLSNETEPYPIRETAQMLINLYPNKNLKLGFRNASDAEKRGYTNYKLVQMDNHKVMALGWKPLVKLEDGLKRTVDYFINERKA